MAFRFIHNLIEKTKEVYNRPYEEARQEKLEHQRKIWEEQGNELKARQESENFIHYCFNCRFKVTVGYRKFVFANSFR